MLPSICCETACRFGCQRHAPSASPLEAIAVRSQRALRRVAAKFSPNSFKLCKVSVSKVLGVLDSGPKLAGAWEQLSSGLRRLSKPREV